MAEPLADISPNKVYGTSQASSPQKLSDDAAILSSEGGSDYSVIEYNLPNFSSSVIGGKHSRSVNNSPMKVTKKTKYDNLDESTKENHDISFATAIGGDEDVFGGVSLRKDEEHTASFDANLSGFSDIMDGAGVTRENEEQIGEKSVDRQILRESYRRERSVDRGSAFNTPTKPPNFSLSGSNRHSWSSPKSEPMTPGTVTPRANGPSRLAVLSQYSKSPESTPGDPERTQNLLLDFTAQFNAITARPPPTPTRSRRRSNSASPTKRTRDGAESPSKHPLPFATPMERKFLLDFDIPPPPTPRSIPTITPKELENIKSQYMAQIAQLKAELVGKDAQVQTLKDAVSDAERRASNGIVELRQVREEMEDMSARSMLIESKLTEAGRAVNELQDQLEEANRQLEGASSGRESIETERDNYKKEIDELRKENGDVSDALLKAKQDLVAAKKSLIFEQQKRMSSGPGSPKGGSMTSGNNGDAESAVTTAVAAANATKDMEISQAVEKVAKELHTLYKSKHEQKVTALKQSYAKRWEKRISELEAKNSELTSLNNDLSNKLTIMEEENEENLTGPVISPQELEQQRQEIQMLKDEATHAKQQVRNLEEELEAERQEKSELVLAVDELLALGGVPTVQESGMGSLKGSVSRASGVGIARGLSPVKSEKETKSSNSLRGGIERMGGGAGGGRGRFGFPK